MMKRVVFACLAVLALAGCAQGTAAADGTAGASATPSTSATSPGTIVAPDRAPRPVTRDTPAAPRPSTSPSTTKPLRPSPATRVTKPVDARTWAAISRAVHESPLTSAVPDGAYVVVGLRLSGHDEHWAGGMLEPRTKNALQPAGVLLHRAGDTWTVSDLGTAQLGCGIAPLPVLRDLSFFGSPPEC
jgi:hypothetical protein